MKELELKARAKINLSLDVVGLRPDGYHLLSTVMQNVELHDLVKLRVAEEPVKKHAQISIFADQSVVPLDHNNICYRAARRWLQASDLSYNIEITLEKHIPTEAGLGGGSSDAAAVLQGLNDLSSKPLPLTQLFDIAATLGADVPFCLHGGLALCEGVGEIIRPLPQLPARPLLLLKPPFGLSTKKVFVKYDQLATTRTASSPQVVKAIESGSWQQLGQVTKNALETAALDLQPQLKIYLQALQKTSAEMLLMTGAGTCVYAVYENELLREQAAAKVVQELPTSTKLIKTNTFIRGNR